MKDSTINQIEILTQKYQGLQYVKPYILEALDLMVESFEKGKKLLICGNGGSAADGDRMAGALLKSFAKERPISQRVVEKISKVAPEEVEFFVKNLEQGLPVISLSNQPSFLTAYSNDKDYDVAFANEVLAYGRKGDTLFAISTSGNSRNVILAALVAKSLGMNVIALTGDFDSKLKEIADVTIKAPSQQALRIHELHLPIYQALCLAVEEEMFD